MGLPPDKVLPTNDGRRRLPSFFDDQEPHSIQAVSPYSVHVEDRHRQIHKRDSVVEHRHVGLLPEPVLGGDAKATHPHSGSRISDSGFSRHDSLFSFGVPPARNAAELKSLLGNSSSRLRPGATVLPHHVQAMDKATQPPHAVSLERAKSRARVEVDIVLESDCCIAGGYLRGHVKVRVRKRQKKEAPVLLADGRVRVIGFECIPGTRDYHTFYQRASALSAVTDALARIYDSPPDAEGFSRAMEGVHILPFAMHLSEDETFGSAKGTVNIHSGAALRYIAMISVKVKDSQTLKRSIAHFYRDCEVWPRLNLNVMLATPSRPIQASSAKCLSVIGGGGQLRLTAMLHRSTWIAGQRCYVRLGLSNDTKRIVRTVALTLIRTTTLFKYQPVAESDGSQSPEEEACQTIVSQKVVAESCLEKSHSASKHHASTDGWWAGVRGGEDVCFAHHVLIPSDALSVSRSRLIQVEYSIRVTASAGALAPDVHVSLPLHIINFLSVDPTPSDPLLSFDGSYARLVPFDHSHYLGTPAIQSDTDNTALYTLSELSTISIDRLSDSPSMSTLSGYHPSTSPTRTTPASEDVLDRVATFAKPSPTRMKPPGREPNTPSPLWTSASRDNPAAPPTSKSGVSMYSTDSYTSSSSPTTPTTLDHTVIHFPNAVLGTLELHDDAGSYEEVASVIDAAQGRRISARSDSSRRDVDSRHSQGQGRSKSSSSPQAPSLNPPAQITQTPQRHRPVATLATLPSMIARGIPSHRNLSSTRPEEPTGIVVPPINPVGHEDQKREQSTTPTLHPSTVSFGMSARPSWHGNSNHAGVMSGASPHPGSPHRRRPSRSLPQPPLQPQSVSDVLPCMSALEVHRLSHLESSRAMNSGSNSAMNPPGSASGSPDIQASGNGSRSAITQRSPPISRTSLASASSSPATALWSSDGAPLSSSSSRVPRGRPGTVPASGSGSTLKAQPVDQAQKAGRTRSNSSVVKGRIAAYEDRLRSSTD
ncbi:hypothetical protein V8D89_015717, partial [Ganoderma adspersum]